MNKKLIVGLVATATISSIVPAENALATTNDDFSNIGIDNQNTTDSAVTIMSVPKIQSTFTQDDILSVSSDEDIMSYQWVIDNQNVDEFEKDLDITSEYGQAKEIYCNVTYKSGQIKKTNLSYNINDETKGYDSVFLKPQSSMLYSVAPLSLNTLSVEDGYTEVPNVPLDNFRYKIIENDTSGAFEVNGIPSNALNVYTSYYSGSFINTYVVPVGTKLSIYMGGSSNNSPYTFELGGCYNLEAKHIGIKCEFVVTQGRYDFCRTVDGNTRVRILAVEGGTNEIDSMVIAAQTSLQNIEINNGTTVNNITQVVKETVGSEYSVSTVFTDTKDSTESTDGYRKGTCTITNGNKNSSFNFKLIIPKTGQSINTIYNTLDSFCNNYNVANSSKVSDFTNAVTITNPIYSIDVANWLLTPSKENTNGNLSCNVNIRENGSVVKTINVNKVINIQNQSIATVSSLYASYLNSMSISNNTTQQDILNGVNITNQNIKATISGFSITPASETTKGLIQGVINISDNSTGSSKTVPINLTIDYLSQSCESVAKLYYEASKSYVASNNTIATDVIGMIKVTNPDITVRADNFKLIPASDEQTGKISCNLVISDGVNTITQPVQMTINIYNEELATALQKAQSYLSNVIATNDTDTDSLLIAINGSISNSNIFVSYNNENPIVKTKATEDNLGSITGSLLLADSQGHKVKVPVNLKINKLNQSIDNAESKIKAYISNLKGSNDLKESDILFGSQNLIDKDSNIVVAIKDFNIIKANKDETGSLSGTVSISDGVNIREIPINLDINLQAQDIANVINRINNKLSGYYLTNDTIASDLEYYLQDCITGAEGSTIKIKIKDSDFNIDKATPYQSGNVYGDITIVDDDANIEYLHFNIAIKQLPDNADKAKENLEIALPDFDVDNGTTVEDLKDMIKGVVTSNIDIDIEDFNKILATSSSKGKITATINLTDDKGSAATVELDLTIKKLSQTVSEAKKDLEVNLPDFDVNNDTTAKDLKDMIEGIVTDNINVDIADFNKIVSTALSKGKITATVKLTDDEGATETVKLDLTIKKLSQTLDEAKKDLEVNLPDFNVNNDTTKSDLEKMIKDVVSPNINITINDFNKIVSTALSKGKITATVKLTDDKGATETVKLDLTIKKLSQTLDEAKKDLEVNLPDFNVNNNTTAKDLKDMIEGVVTDNINVDIADFNKSLATTTQNGNITATVNLVDDKGATSKFELNLSILKLQQNIDEAKDSLVIVISNLVATNDTTADSLKNQIDSKLAENITTDIKDFNKILATNKSEGKVTAIVTVTDNNTNQSIDISLNLTINTIPAGSSSSGGSGGSGGSSSSGKNHSSSRDDDDDADDSTGGLELNLEKQSNTNTFSGNPNWLNDNGKWKYKDGDSFHVGWLYLNSKWYYFDASGYMQIGWVNINGQWFYFNKDGYMTTGWLKDNNAWYYLSTKQDKSYGAMQTGWKYINSGWYYFNNNGTMKTGWLKDSDGTYYYLDSNSGMRTGWSAIDGQWYYFDKDGSMKTGWIDYNHHWCYSNLKGVMQTGWVEINGSWYYFDKNGFMQTNSTVDGWKLSSSGAMVS